MGWGRQPFPGQGHSDNDAILSKGQQYSSQIPVLPDWGGHGEEVDTSLLSQGQAFSLPHGPNQKAQGTGIS